MRKVGGGEEKEVQLRQVSAMENEDERLQKINKEVDCRKVQFPNPAAIEKQIFQKFTFTYPPFLFLSAPFLVQSLLFFSGGRGRGEQKKFIQLLRCFYSIHCRLFNLFLSLFFSSIYSFIYIFIRLLLLLCDFIIVKVSQKF